MRRSWICGHSSAIIPKFNIDIKGKEGRGTIDSSFCNFASDETSCRSVVQTFASVDSAGAAGAGAVTACSTFASAIFGTTIEFERALSVAAGIWFWG